MRAIIITHKTFYRSLAYAIMAFALLLALMSCNSSNKMMKTQKINRNGSESSEIGAGRSYENTEIITERDLERLPSPVKRWLKHVSIVGKEKIVSAWISQESEMQMKPGQDSWYTARSEQVFHVENPAFFWNVKMKMGVLWVKGTDKYEYGKGSMKMKLLSLFPVVNASGPKIDEGALQRFMGEIVWFPQAAIMPYFTWHAIDDTTARAVLEIHGLQVEGIYKFNDEGDFVGFEAMRFKGNGPDAERVPWIIRVQGYDVFEGVRIPSRLTVTWKMDEGDWTWLKMKITHAAYNPEHLNIR